VEEASLAPAAPPATGISLLAAAVGIGLILLGAGLPAREKEGRVHRCRLIATPMRDAAEWIAKYQQFWEGQ
jgi:hypothetical protein